MHHFRGKATTTVRYRYTFLNFRSIHLCERLQSPKKLGRQAQISNKIVITEDIDQNFVALHGKGLLGTCPAAARSSHRACRR